MVNYVSWIFVNLHQIAFPRSYIYHIPQSKKKRNQDSNLQVLLRTGLKRKERGKKKKRKGRKKKKKTLINVCFHLAEAYQPFRSILSTFAL